MRISRAACAAVAVATSVAEQAKTLDIELCQDDECGRLRLPDVARFDPGYSTFWDVAVDLDRFGDVDWQPGEATAEITGSDTAGDLLLESSKAVTFRETQPNGPGCDPTVLMDRIRVP